jgi:hypothetical protein
VYAEDTLEVENSMLLACEAFMDLPALESSSKEFLSREFIFYIELSYFGGEAFLNLLCFKKYVLVAVLTTHIMKF